MEFDGAFQFVSGNENAHLNLTYPAGTTDLFAYQPIVLPIDAGSQGDFTGPTSVVTATVQYFSPGISCSPIFDRIKFGFPLLQGNVHSWSVASSDSLNVTITTNYTLSETNGTSVPWTSQSDSNMTVQSSGKWSGSLAVPPGYLAYFWITSDNKTSSCKAYVQAYETGCGTHKNETVPILEVTAPWGDGCDDDALVLVAQECRALDDLAVNFTATLLHCQPEDRSGRATLRFKNTLDGGLPEVMSLDEAAPQSSAKTNARRLISLVLYGFVGEQGSMVAGDLPFILDFLNYVVPTPVDGWINASSLSNALRTAYPAIAVQVFRSFNLVPSNGTITGTVTGSSPRLSVQSLSCLLMMVLLVLTASCCAALAFSFTNSIKKRQLAATAVMVPRNPARLAGSTVLLARSPHLDEALGAGRRRREDVARGSVGAWWRPWGTTVVSRLATVAAVAASVAVLQITCYVAGKNAGIALVTVDGWSQYCWTYIPSILVVALGQLVVRLEFNLRLLQPFSVLAKGGPGARNGLFDDEIYPFLATRLFNLARSRQVGLMFVTLATLPLPFATIIIGDLFILSGVPSIQSGYSFVQLDGFDTSKLYNWSATDEPSPNFDYNNVLAPAQFMTDTYALASISLPEGTTTTAARGAKRNITVTIPATRGRLNCTVLPESAAKCMETTFTYPNTTAASPDGVSTGTVAITDANKTAANNDTLSTPAGVYPLRVPCVSWDVVLPPDSMPLPPGCPATVFRPHPPWSDENTTCYDPFVDTRPYPPDFLRTTDIYNLTSSYQGDLYHEELYEYMYGESADPAECPLVMTNWGRAVPGSCKDTTTTFAACLPHIEVLPDLSVVLSLPELEVLQVLDPRARGAGDAAAAPATTLNILGVGPALRMWKSVNNVAAPPSAGSSAAAAAAAVASSPRFSPFYYSPIAVAGPFLVITERGGPVTEAEYVSTADRDRAKVLAALDALWARSMARVANDVLRSAVGSAGAGTLRSDGVLTDAGRQRLLQNDVSTRVLQGIYASVALCLVVGFWVLGRGGGGGPRGEVLPFPPSSIGALVGLLAGSKILGGADVDGTATGGIVPPGAERLSDEELKKDGGVFAVHGEYYLKWWGGGHEDGIVNEASEEEERKRWYGIDFEVTS